MRGAGHTVGNARWEAGNVRDVLDYYAAAPERLFGRQIPVAGGMDVTFREPLGVVGIIVPWNFPMPIAGWGFAPALAAGNTVVLKPAELTPLTALRLAELGREAGLPAGRVHGAAGQGLGGRGAAGHPRAGSQDRVHRLDRGRHAHPAPGCGPGQTGHPRARRQVARTSSSPTRTSSGRRRARPRACSTTRARTAARARGSWSSARCTTGSWSCWNPPSPGCASGRRRRRTSTWAR